MLAALTAGARGAGAGIRSGSAVALGLAGDSVHVLCARQEGGKVPLTKPAVIGFPLGSKSYQLVVSVLVIQ